MKVSAGSLQTSEESDFVGGACEVRSLSPERRRPLNSCSARKRSFESSRSMPSSEDAQRNGPYRRNGVTRSNRARPPPKHDVAYLRAGNNPSATPKLSHKIHRRRSRAL